MNPMMAYAMQMQQQMMASGPAKAGFCWFRVYVPVSPYFPQYIEEACLRGNHLSNATCPTQAFLTTGK